MKGNPASLQRLYSVILLLLVWIALASVFPPHIVPGPVVVLENVWENVAAQGAFSSQGAFFHIYKTVLRVVLGLVFAMIWGTAIGVVMGVSARGEKFFDGWVMVGLTIPAIVYGMVTLMWFGLNDFAAVMAIGVTAFPSVCINIWHGVKDIDMQLVDMAKVFQLQRGEIVRKVILPQIVPFILAATRYALGISWKICTTVELIGMSSGVGFMLNYWFGLFSMPQVFAWTFTFMVVLFLIEFGIIKPVERHLLAWRPAVHV